MEKIVESFFFATRTANRMYQWEVFLEWQLMQFHNYSNNIGMV